MKKCLLILLTALTSTTLWAAGVKTGEDAPDFTLTDSNGTEHSLSDFEGKMVVLEWTNYSCPFVKKHYKNGDMQATQKKYTDEGVVWLTIAGSAPGKQGHHTADEWNKQLEKAKAAGTALLMDEDGTVGRAYNAKVTPHMYVIHKDGTLVYQGAIDSNSSWDPDDVAGAENYVASALDSLMAGEAIKTATTKPYGCGVKY